MDYSFICYFIKQYIHFINTSLCGDKFHRLMMILTAIYEGRLISDCKYLLSKVLKNVS